MDRLALRKRPSAGDSRRSSVGSRSLGSLGVAVLVLVISVMNGFDDELKRRILGTISHLVAYPDPTTTDAAFGAFADGFVSFEAEGMVARNGGVNAVAILGLDEDGLHSRADPHRIDGRR